MSALSQEDRDRLLSDLSRMGSSGQAETESDQTFAKTFLPVAEHARAFDPDVALIVGERGAGKSEIFRAVVKEGLLDSILQNVGGSRAVRLTASNTTWLAGHPLKTGFPDAVGLRTFISRERHVPDEVQALWFAYLTRVLREFFPGGHPLDSSPLLTLPGADVDGITGAFGRVRTPALILLDELDKHLDKEKRWIFVSYDELDTLGGYDWNTMVAAIQGLISFWASYSRRWTRIRAKIFLRTDLFRRHAQVLGADLSKLAANRAEVTWSDRNLYAMLAKRIVNTSGALEQYCRRSRLEFDVDRTLGLIPRMQKSEDARPLIERLAGQYMGAEPKKGLTFRWLLSHVRDGNDRAMPRALVRLIEQAADEERRVPRATHNRLLAPASLRRALDTVSQYHVLQANTNELPWLFGVAKRLKGHGAPMQQREAEKALAQDWSEEWGPSEFQGVHPPVDKPGALVDYLIEIGVFRQRAGGKVDVPDLFLAGLGMTRKGGVARR